MDRKEAQDCLDSGRMVNTARFNDPQVGAFYSMNVAGRPIRVFPTLVATEESYAFRRDEEGRPGQGMVYNRQLRGWVTPNNNERERISGCRRGQLSRRGSKSVGRSAISPLEGPLTFGHTRGFARRSSAGGPLGRGTSCERAKG
jgi:hypothetical protein